MVRGISIVVVFFFLVGAAELGHLVDENKRKMRRDTKNVTVASSRMHCFFRSLFSSVHQQRDPPHLPKGPSAFIRD